MGMYSVKWFDLVPMISIMFRQDVWRADTHTHAPPTRIYMYINIGKYR